mmetsp:Transcript_33721/g.78954  ORF Transcript_33721/g.78954 Transcript_33721/m.78954 type:complete len:97 (-) Transcript_33721:133-423(-)
MPEDNEDQGVCFLQPRTLPARLAIAKKLQEDFLPQDANLVVDDMDNAIDTAYEARPERIYVIEDNHVVFRTGVGPYCYSTAKLARFLTSRLDPAQA